MAAFALSKVSTKVKLNNGTDASGNDKYVTISMPNEDEEYFSSDKASYGTKMLAIITSLSPCLSKTISTVEVTSAERLTAE